MNDEQIKLPMTPEETEAERKRLLGEMIGADLNAPVEPMDVPKPELINGVPVSRMKDGSDLEQIRRLQNADDGGKDDETALMDELLETSPVKEETPKTVKKVSGKDGFKAFKQALGSASIVVRLYSEDREIVLRELTVTDQKTMSKTALANNSRRDVIYNSQCAMINQCCKTPKFDIKDYTEFDRIAVLLRLYEQNYFKNTVKFTCPSCGKENNYALDFGKILDGIRKAWTPDEVVDVEHGGKKFKITIGWPSVSSVSEFYRAYYKNYAGANDSAKNTIDQLSNVEYLVMFIKEIELAVSDSESIRLDLTDYSYAERSDLIDSLPQGIIFDDDTGIINKVVSDFTDKLNKAFQYEKCQFCGAQTEEGIGSVADFM